VRVSFATNDERTAKRVSDALGTATEMKAMKNYAGHRLSPWLGHLMVSRSETARPLLTPGEVMQLPLGDEIVMLAGTPPIRAKKARYFEDPRMNERILAPPALAAASGKADDWTALPLPPPASSAAPPENQVSEGDGESDNSGWRRQPEFDHPTPSSAPPVNEFEIETPDEADDLAASNNRMARMVRGAARQVALDPGDGMEL
jgi:type IV secretion system protein VirD4